VVVDLSAATTSCRKAGAAPVTHANHSSLTSQPASASTASLCSSLARVAGHAGNSASVETVASTDGGRASIYDSTACSTRSARTTRARWCVQRCVPTSIDHATARHPASGSRDTGTTGAARTRPSGAAASPRVGHSRAARVFRCGVPLIVR
jgi:hypothetical protein